MFVKVIRLYVGNRPSLKNLESNQIVHKREIPTRAGYGLKLLITILIKSIIAMPT